MDLLVVGAGTMGRWFASAVAEPVDRVAFVDRDRDAAEAAVEAVDGHAAVLDASGTDPGDERETFTAVCIAVPMAAVGDAVAAHADRAERAILDVAGVAEPAVEAMRTYAPDRERASLHPLFSSANEPGTVATVVDDGGPVVDRLLEALRSRGNRLVETTASEHDEAMETIQARAHAAVLAYALTADEVPEGFRTPVSRRLAEAVEDVTGGNSRVYADVQEAFDGAEDIAAAARRIADADREAFERLYAETTEAFDGEDQG